MFKLIQKDMERYFQLDRTPSTNSQLSLIEKIRIVLVSYGLHVCITYRFIRFIDKYWAKNVLWKFVISPFKLLSICGGFVSLVLYGTMINRGADIGAGLYIGHVGGIVIGATTIGKNFTTTHNMTIGIGKAGKDKGIPVIGDNVWIATNTVIYGKINIGSGVAISPGSIVSKDIAEKCLVAGNPARVINQDFDNVSLLYIPRESKKSGLEVSKPTVSAFKFYLPFNHTSSVLTIGDLNGEIAMSISQHAKHIICYYNNFSKALNVSNKIKKNGIQNVSILVGKDSDFPLKNKCVSIMTKHNCNPDKENTINQIDAVDRILTRNAFVYYSFETTQWKWFFKWYKINNFRKIWFKRGYSRNLIISHYTSFIKIYFLQSISSHWEFGLKDVYVYFKQLLVANNWGEIIFFSNHASPQKKYISFIEKIMGEINANQGHDFQNLIKLWVSSTGSIVAEFEKGIVRLPMDDFSHGKIKNNYAQLGKLEIQKSMFPVPRPVGRGVCRGQSYYAETKLYGISLDRETINKTKIQNITKQAFDLLINHTIKNDILSVQNYKKIIKSNILELSSFLRKEDKKYLYKFYRKARPFFLENRFNLALYHGDFKHSNFIIAKGKKTELLGVIDWEYSKEVGVPFYDLLILLAYNGKHWANNDVRIVERIWNIACATEIDSMVCEYFQKFKIDMILLKPLCLICMIIYLNIMFDSNIKKDNQWYKTMISECLIPSAIEVINFLSRDIKKSPLILMR